MFYYTLLFGGPPFGVPICKSNNICKINQLFSLKYFLYFFWNYQFPSKCYNLSLCHKLGLHIWWSWENISVCWYSSTTLVQTETSLQLLNGLGQNLFQIFMFPTGWILMTLVIPGLFLLVSPFGLHLWFVNYKLRWIDVQFASDIWSPCQDDLELITLVILLAPSSSPNICNTVDIPIILSWSS